MIEIRPIRNETEYEGALREIDALFDAEPGTPAADKLEVLVILIEAYEAKHHTLPAPDPIEAVEHALERLGLTQQDLRPYIGSRSRVWEIMNRRRPLTLPMIRKLAVGLGIPADLLVGNYVVAAGDEERRGTRAAPPDVQHASSVAL
jgi:HTH-type transcriptional regulator/antitoxin HigA